MEGGERKVWLDDAPIKVCVCPKASLILDQKMSTIAQTLPERVSLTQFLKVKGNILDTDLSSKSISM